jgi:hypothetical protein
MEHSIILHTDSLGSIQNIINPQTRHPLALEIQQIVMARAQGEKDTVLHWVPSHIGIHGNHIADARAKYAAKNEPHIKREFPPSQTQVSLAIKRRTLERWALTDKSVTNSPSWDWYVAVSREIPPISPCLHKIQQHAAVRFRAGYRRTADLPYRTLCDCGEAIFSVAHVLTNCRSMDHMPILHLCCDEEAATLTEQALAIRTILEASKEDYTPLAALLKLNPQIIA